MESIKQILKHTTALTQQQSLTLQQKIEEALHPSEETLLKRKALHEEEQQRELRQRKHLIEVMIKRSNLPKRLTGKSINDYIITNKNIQAKKALENYNKSYYIYGECGTGKTFLASIIIKLLAKENIQSYFFTSTDLFFLLNPYNQKNKTEEYEPPQFTRKQIQQCGCLVIDDLGAEKPSAFTNSVLFDIINYRYNEEKQIIITSNFSIVDLQKRWGDYEGRRVGRRITEMCKPIFLE